MKRTEFIRLSIGLTGFAGWLYSCSPKQKIKGGMVDDGASIGHLLRDKKLDTPARTIQKKIVIIGGGVSGLSAARWLKRNNIEDFLLLDLDRRAGGNAGWGENHISSFPWGAHYIPTPNNDLTEYLAFLQDCKVIKSVNNDGFPEYNDEYLCFDPQERLYINGRWQEGLVPNYGVPPDQLKQIDNFLQLMDQYRHQKGKDGKDAFAIPVDMSSTDPEFVQLDNSTMAAWMHENGFSSDYLHQYVNYCCRDDFGTPHDIVSAWAGIHYFASRKGKGTNAEHGDVLTWSEGNGFLIKQLQKDIDAHISVQSLATKVETTTNGLRIAYLDVQNNTLVEIECQQCILACPQFVAARLLQDAARIDTTKQHFHYAPWMVANLLVDPLEERSGAAASWDNVIFESSSLGYVNASHQVLRQDGRARNLTYYLPLTSKKPEEERSIAQQRTFEDWVALIENDLAIIHPGIRNAIREVNIRLWGHAMAQPTPGFIHGNVRRQLSASIGNRIHFAHTDLAGISIFEEGFYQGINAAKKIMQTFQ